MNNELLADCPFCGSPNTRLIQHENCWVRCDDCDATGKHAYSEYTEPMRSEAIKAWNTRASAPGRKEMKDHFEQNMLDGAKVEDCGKAMLSAESIWDYIEQFFPPAGLALEEGAVARHFYEQYVLETKKISEQFKFDKWEDLPADDKMRLAFTHSAKNLCAKFTAASPAGVTEQEELARLEHKFDQEELLP